MKKNTRRRGRKCNNYSKKSMRQKRLTRSKHSRRRMGGVSTRSKQSMAPTPSKASSKGVVVIRNGLNIQPHIPSSSLRIAGIAKSATDPIDVDAIYAANLISKFPLGMDKFLQIVIKNYEILNYEKVKIALRDKISINKDQAVGRLSMNGIIFISYISGRLACLLKELSMTKSEEHDKKREILVKIKQLEKVICLLDDVGCSWGIRPYNLHEMNIIAEYYKNIKNDAGFEEYNRLLTEFINKHFPILTKYTDPSHVVSSSMCRRLIPRSLLETLPEDDPMGDT
uniref:Uncharacterized protein n=1 Tax=viral metagenome TaxID=1070528 RepID=A0A6C0EYR4_9ZZZZ